MRLGLLFFLRNSPVFPYHTPTLQGTTDTTHTISAVFCKQPLFYNAAELRASPFMCSVCIAYSFHALFVHGRYRYAVPRSRDFPASIPSQTATATLYESRRSSACERSRLKLQFPCQTRSFRQTLRKQTTSCTVSERSVVYTISCV